MIRGELLKGSLIAGFAAFVLALAETYVIAAETVQVDPAIPTYSKDERGFREHQQHRLGHDE